MSRPRPYAPEVRERAVRLVFEHTPDCASQWAAIESLVAKMGYSAETLRHWVRPLAELVAGDAPFGRRAPPPPQQERCEHHVAIAAKPEPATPGGHPPYRAPFFGKYSTPGSPSKSSSCVHTVPPTACAVAHTMLSASGSLCSIPARPAARASAASNSMTSP